MTMMDDPLGSLHLHLHLRTQLHLLPGLLTCGLQDKVLIPNPT